MSVQLAERTLAGDRHALAQLLTRLENGGVAAVDALRALYPRAGRAHIIGLTGPPGSGKSTLATALARQYRSRGERVAILAVDPTSPYSGGAFLGDRVRMEALADDAGVFVRSMASRGTLGGLAPGTADAIVALDAAGYSRIVVETVGVGQDEVAVAEVVHTTVVVTVPGLGDEVQALKAGLLETADVLVVNKADRPEADAARAALVMLQSLADTPAWQPPILATAAIRQEGIDALLAALDRHRAFLEHDVEGERRAAARARAAVRAAAERLLIERLDHAVHSPRWAASLQAVTAHARLPHDVASDLVGALDRMGEL